MMTERKTIQLINEDTGEYNTAYMFSQLVSLSRDY